MAASLDGRYILVDAAIEQRVNSVISFLVPCAIIAVASAAVFALHPEYASGRSLVGLVTFLVPLVIAVAASFAYVRRVSSGANDDG